MKIVIDKLVPFQSSNLQILISSKFEPDILGNVIVVAVINYVQMMTHWSRRNPLSDVTAAVLRKRGKLETDAHTRNAT